MNHRNINRRLFTLHSSWRVLFVATVSSVALHQYAIAQTNIQEELSRVMLEQVAVWKSVESLHYNVQSITAMGLAGYSDYILSLSSKDASSETSASQPPTRDSLSNTKTAMIYSYGKTYAIDAENIGPDKQVFWTAKGRRIGTSHQSWVNFAKNANISTKDSIVYNNKINGTEIAFSNCDPISTLYNFLAEEINPNYYAAVPVLLLSDTTLWNSYISKVSSVDKTNVNGFECVTLKSKWNDNNTLRASFSIKHNYYPVAFDFVNVDGLVVKKMRVTSLSSKTIIGSTQKVWYPDKSVLDLYFCPPNEVNDKNCFYSQNMTVSSFETNTPIDESKLSELDPASVRTIFDATANKWIHVTE